MPEEIFVGSGNVFEDIELPRPKELLAKAKLIHRIDTVIENQGLKRKDAAKLLRRHPKELSLIMNGALFDEVTIGQFMDYLVALNGHIRITVCYQPNSV